MKSWVNTSPHALPYALNICGKVVNVKEQGSLVRPLAIRHSPFHYQSAQRFHAAVKVYRSLSGIQRARREDADFLWFQLSCPRATIRRLGLTPGRRHRSLFPVVLPADRRPRHGVRDIKSATSAGNQTQAIRVASYAAAESTSRYRYGGERVDRSLPRPSVNPGFTKAVGSPRSIGGMVPHEPLGLFTFALCHWRFAF